MGRGSTHHRPVHKYRNIQMNIGEEKYRHAQNSTTKRYFFFIRSIGGMLISKVTGSKRDVVAKMYVKNRTRKIEIKERWNKITKI